MDLHDGDQVKVGATMLGVQVEVAKTVLAILCQKCGKDATSEAGPGQQGDFICASCRQQLESGPVDALLNLLQQGQVSQGAHLHLPDYQIQKKLGEGGMGAVYLVKHRRDGRLAALKVMLSKVAVDVNAKREFLREIENTQALQHKYIVTFLDSGVEKSIIYFLVEYCQGGSIYDLMQRQRRYLTLKEAMPMMLQALEGLAFAHQQGFVHRDLKPQNILLSGAEGQQVAKIADLGLAKSFITAGLSGMTVTAGGASGSLPFMPREQLTNFKYIKPVSDVWAMGATCYNILTGAYPRDYQQGQDPVEMVLYGQIVPIRQRNAQIPKNVAAVIDRSLAQDSKDRYQTAGEMLKALAACR